MLDIRQIRQNPELFEQDLVRRKQPEKIPLLKELIKLDREYRLLLGKAEEIRNKKNQITKEIEKLKKEKKPLASKIKEAKKLPVKLKIIETKQFKFKEKIDNYLLRLPNPLHESVPFGKDENDNKVVRTKGGPSRHDFALAHHGVLAKNLKQADFERAVKISGAGFFFLKNDLALLDFALARFALDELLKKGFELVLPPLLMRKKFYEAVTDLEAFNDMIYKIDGQDLFLIATSEHPIAAMFAGEIMEEKDLPVKICSFSPCFRKEVGKHSIDERGFFRVHQFNKVEQFVFCRPSESWGFLEELVRNSETVLEKLGLHYQVVDVCSGDIGSVAAKKYDINAWSSREKKFIEVMSVSNCTSYQSVGLGIKYRKKDGEKDFLHTLNGTMLATSRILRLLLEEFQTKDGGFKIPKALQPFMGGKKEILPEKI